MEGRKDFEILPSKCLSDLSQHKTFANPKRLRFRVEAIRLNQCVLIDNEHPCKYDHGAVAQIRIRSSDGYDPNNSAVVEWTLIGDC